MSNKNKDNKTKRGKKRVSSAVIAEVVECAPSTVSMVLSGERNGDTALGQRIEIAGMLLEEGFDKLVNEVKRVVKI